MPAGFETYTPDGRVQLLANMTYFRLEQRIDLPTSGWGQFGNNSGQRDVFVAGLTMADAPMMALTATTHTWADIVSTANGGITWRVYAVNPSASTIVAIVFSQRRPPVSDHMAGAEFFMTDGTIAWSSDYPIARPLGVITQNGYSGVSVAGRHLAHVPQKQEVSTALSFTYAGLGSCRQGNTNGYQVYRRDQWARTGVTAWGGGTIYGASNAFYADSGNIQYTCALSPQSVPISQNIGSLGGWRSLVLDVTNF